VVLHDPLTPTEHVQLGIAYEAEGKWDSALAEYRAALKKDRRHLPALVNTGNVHTQLQQYAKAERYYRDALKLDPNHPMANNNLAWIKIVQRKDLTEAGRLVQKALASDPERRAVYLDTLAYLHLQTGRFAEAVAALDEAEAYLSPEEETLKAHLAHTRALVTRAMQSASGGGANGADRPKEAP
jgi:tetratricopeptide (TPR) repeat protein